MADMEKQNRDAETSVSVGRDNNAWVQDVRDDPSTQLPCRAQNEKLSTYFDRLDEWRKAQVGENNWSPPKEQGETDTEFQQRLQNWSQRKDAIANSVEEAKFKHLLAENQQLQAKNQQLQAIQQLQAEIQQLQAENQQLQAKNQQLDKSGSVLELLETHNGLPKILRNTQAESSSIQKNPNGKRENESNDEGEDVANKKFKSFHKNATIKKLDPFEIYSYFGKFEVNLKEKDSKGIPRLVKSTLATCMGKDRVNPLAKLSNFNESSLSLHIIHVLKDVIHCLGLQAEVAREMSFFSMLPDIVVVQYMDVIVLVVKVKNGGCNMMEVMESESAAGQALDYAFGLKQLGIDVPIVCLSTYSCMRIGSTEKKIEAILDKTVERLDGLNAETNGFQEKKPQPSPAKTGNASEVIPVDLMTGEGKDTEESGTHPEKTIDRVIYMSETFKLENMFQALYFAVACGCVAAEEALLSPTGDANSLKFDPIPKEGQVLKDTWFNVVQEDSYTWTKLGEVKATYKLKTCWPIATKVYMRCVLGMGRSGKVYLCMDSGGKHFAVKMLFYDSESMESFDPERNVRKREDLMEKLKTKLSEEAYRWKAIYPEYTKSIWEGTLNGLPCLAMPYVAPVPVEERENLLPKIRKEMERLVDQGFVYEESDTRWRHVGLRIDRDGNEKIVFVDMESLKEVERMTEMSKREAVDKCLGDLTAWMK